MPCCRYRCPRCGRFANRIQNIQDGRCTPVVDNGDGTVTLGTGNANCACSSTAAELYGVSCREARFHTCCDPYNGCQYYYDPRRNPYWPEFCHPRWLRCDQLYCRGL